MHLKAKGYTIIYRVDKYTQLTQNKQYIIRYLYKFKQKTMKHSNNIPTHLKFIRTVLYSIKT